MTNQADQEVGSPGVIAALIVGVLGAAVLLILPVLLGELAQSYRFTETQLGLYSFADLGGLTLGAALGAVALPAFGLRRCAQLGIGIATIANAGCIPVHLFAPLFALRIVAGLGAGVELAVCYAALGMSKHPDRNFGLYVVLQGVFGAISLQALPWLYPATGVGGVFAGLAVLFAASYAATLALPKAFVRTSDTSTKRGTSQAAWLGLVGVLLFFVAQGAVWAYLQQIGTNGGVDDASAASGLALSALVGLSGPLSATVLGARLGRALPLLVGLALSLVALALFVSHLTPLRFVVAACLFNIGWNLSIPYQVSVIAGVDQNGVAVGWAGAASAGGLAVGPLIAAVVIENAGFVGVLELGAALCTLSVFALTPALLAKARV